MTRSRRSWRYTTIVLAILTLATAGLLWRLNEQAQASLLVEGDALQALKLQLREEPTNEALTTRIRELDLQVRERFFARRQQIRRGVWLLLALTTGLVLAASQAFRAREPLPKPDTVSVYERNKRWSNWGMAGVSLALLGVAWGLGRPPALVLQREPSGPSPPAEDRPVPDNQRWPRFRGPQGSGWVASAQAPLEWNVETGHNVLWRAEVPLPGKSSPVVWGRHILITGADENSRYVYSYDATSGNLHWQLPVATTERGKPENILEDTGYAASTGVCDGERFYAMFANGDVAALTLAGQLIWARNLGLPDNPYGHASSLIMADQRLIIQFDQGYVGQGISQLLALDPSSGETLWQTPRDMPASWSTPIAIEVADEVQIVTTGSPWVMAYRAETGEEVWRADLLYGEIVTSPLYIDGLVYVAAAGGMAAAIRPDGEGDVTESHVVWTREGGLPDIATPVCDGRRLWMIADDLLTCLDAATGDLIYEDELDGMVWASPTLIGNRLYVATIPGEMVVFAADDEYRELARLPMGGACFATQAWAAGRLYVRAGDALFGLQEGPP